MTYVDGFVAAVPNANREKYRQHAEMAASVFKEHGAMDVIECWGDDVPEGKLTSFPMAVKRKDDETVVFSWIVWPSREARMTAWEKIMADPRMQPDKNPMPFDGKRMIYGGFEPIVGAPASDTAAVQPYLFFRGRCEEAIGYYKAKLGAEAVMMLRFKDNPDRPGPDKVPPALDDRIMHAALRIQGALILMSDGWQTGPLDFQCMSLSLSLPTESEADRIFDALAADGTVQMPMAKTFFSPRFGSLTDKFGVSWMIGVFPAG